jgi:hypothetical protein
VNEVDYVGYIRERGLGFGRHRWFLPQSLVEVVPCYPVGTGSVFR